MIGLIALYLLVLIVAIYLMVQSKSDDNFSDEINHVTFIIPFKNEANRIQSLIQSLNQSNWSNHIEIIFVDDHSTDRTIDVILETLDIPFRLLKLKETQGKKMAIAFGVQNTSHEHIHTLDADVSFDKDYLNNICQLPISDLTILPVQLTGNSLFQKLNALEFKWLQTITFALAKLKTPNICNGANLSFSRPVFLKSLETRTDFNQSSGDDIYLLNDVKIKNGKINAFNHKSLHVRTEAPNSFIELISQRKRWVKKVLNRPALVLLLLFCIYHLLPVLALTYVSENILWVLPLAIKIISEFILTNNLIFNQLLLTILHQLYYPIYGIALLISLPFKGKWK